MQGWMNPYEVLGTTRAASLADVREAYHAAVMRCHPDRRPGDPSAVAVFERIVEAYHTILRWRGADAAADPAEPAEPAAPVSASELAARDAVYGGAWTHVESSLPLGPTGRRICRPTRNEPVLFLAIWLVAILAGLGVEWILADRLPQNPRDGGTALAAQTALVAAPLVVYVGILALAVTVPVMSRKVVYLAVRFSLGLRKALPGPRTTPLPRGPKANLP